MVKNDAWAVAHFARNFSMVEQVTKRLVIVTTLTRALAHKWILLGTHFSSRGDSLAQHPGALVRDPMITKADIGRQSRIWPSRMVAGINVIDLDRRLIAYWRRVSLHHTSSLVLA